MHKLGIDIGALFTKGVLLDARGEIVDTWVERHHGNPRKHLSEWLAGARYPDEVAVAVTGHHRGILQSVHGALQCDTVRATVRAAARLSPGVRWVIDIGGGSVTGIELDAAGRFRSFASNSVCAAGTGSFLDEQARRLGIDYDAVAAMEAVDDPPSIASRCAVFAKSDLIHRQQEGYSCAAMWSGLCQGLATTILQTLFKGRPVEGPVLVVGGVSRNRDVVRWLERMGNVEVRTAPGTLGHVSAALGAALVAGDDAVERRWDEIAVEIAAAAGNGGGNGGSADLPRTSLVPQGRPLRLELTHYPSFDVERSYVTDDGSEVRIHRLPEGAVLRGALGIDVGSTSTKCAVVGEDEKVAIDIYRKTSGDPIGAARRLFRALRAALESSGRTLEVLSVGTTGSGRKLVGHLVGADAIVNEITAHAAGALTSDLDVDTIFEIGGQDSKYIRLRDGYACDANMNYVCAAGTGSFVEEQAAKLGYRVQDVGDAVMGVATPLTSDRCTVFMEQDVTKLLRQGYSREEALAGVLRSVVRNYLAKVVGRRPVSRTKVAFMGATARNRGLVAAFEQALGVEVVVSPACHVMGALGVACLALRRRPALGRTRFRGLECLDGEIDLRQERCEMCRNKCPITFAKGPTQDEPISWGYMCGREPDERKVRRIAAFETIEKRDQRWRAAGRTADVRSTGISIGLPRALHLFDELPRWRALLEALGARVVVSPETDGRIAKATQALVASEFCYPAKLVHGHARALLENPEVDFVLLPHRIADRRNRATTDAHFCPYVQGMPGVVNSAFRCAGLDDMKVLSPIVDLRVPEKTQVRRLYKTLGPVLGSTEEAVAAAWRAAERAQADFAARIAADTEAALARATAEDKPAFVLIGRPYNLYDAGINLGLPRKIAEHGMTVAPLDGLAFREEDVPAEYRNTYWAFAQRIVAALVRVARTPNLYPIFFTNFSCGPDSFTLTYAERIMGGRPMLILELDEHGADAGYMTRIEAFVDVVRQVETRRKAGTAAKTTDRPAARRRPAAGARPVSGESIGADWKRRRVWFPPMHSVGGPFLAAVFRRSGIEARALPGEDRAAFEIGRQVTRGTECLPTALTIGALIKKLRETGADPAREAFFMPTAEGPCRFGQYATLHRQILDDNGFGDVVIVSPSSYNSYQGIPERIRREMWRAIVASDLLFKAICKARPYEREAGAVDRAAAVHQALIERAIESGADWEPALAHAVRSIAALRGDGPSRPLVGVVGEIYVRCNGYSNGEAIRAIEAAGGEGWLAPLGEWILYTSENSMREGIDGTNPFRPLDLAATYLKDRFLHSEERRIHSLADPFLADRHEPPVRRVIEAGSKYVPPEFAGEAILTMGRAILFARQGASMVVNCSPFGCMPGTLTSACFQEVQSQTGVPMVSMFYDGDLDLNDRVRSYIANVCGTREAGVPIPRVSRTDIEMWA
ncbi:MAG: acyl-CoA dehydratase activase [Myxococcota bacterium]|nr:acyl-CoA dehydratase activase [Myxococcota bacterium]